MLTATFIVISIIVISIVSYFGYNAMENALYNHVVEEYNRSSIARMEAMLADKEAAYQARHAHDVIIHPTADEIRANYDEYVEDWQATGDLNTGYVWFKKRTEIARKESERLEYIRVFQQKYAYRSAQRAYSISLLVYLNRMRREEELEDSNSSSKEVIAEQYDDDMLSLKEEDKDDDYEDYIWGMAECLDQALHDGEFYFAMSCFGDTEVIAKYKEVCGEEPYFPVF